LLVDALSEAFITVNQTPPPEVSVHGGGSTPVLAPEVAPVNELPTQAAAPSYIAVPPWGLVLFCAEAVPATNRTSAATTIKPFTNDLQLHGSIDFSIVPPDLLD